MMINITEDCNLHSHCIEDFRPHTK